MRLIIALCVAIPLFFVVDCFGGSTEETTGLVLEKHYQGSSIGVGPATNGSTTTIVTGPSRTLILQYENGNVKEVNVSLRVYTKSIENTWVPVTIRRGMTGIPYRTSVK